MKIKWFFKRYIIFILLLLFVIPSIFSLFIHAADYHYKIRTVFLLQRFYIIFSALILVLLIVAYEKIKNYKGGGKNNNNKHVFVFFVLSVLFFTLAFSTQIDYDKILSEGVGVGNRVNFDKARWLSPSILSDVDVIKDKSIILFDDSEKLKREVIISKIPERAEIIWSGFWQDQNNNGFDSDCAVALKVNNNTFDITEQYSNLEPNRKDWMKLVIDKNYLVQGKNILVIEKHCSDAVAIVSQTTYINKQTLEFKDGKWSYPSFDEIVLFVKQRNGFIFDILFKLGFIFRVLAVICLFIAVFGLNFLNFLFRRAKLELGFSFIYALFMYWFATFIRGYWLFLSKLVTYANYALLKISFLKPVVDFSNPNLPFLGVKDFILGIADTCSGIESLGYFVLAYSALIIINWNKVDFKKALLLFVPGLFGAFFVNILRVYLLFIIGIFISKSFALNAYHTNAAMVLFIIYFMIFWPLVMKFIKRK